MRDNQPLKWKQDSEKKGQESQYTSKAIMATALNYKIDTKA